MGEVFEDVPLVEFMYLVFTRPPGESYRRRLGSLLLHLCYVFRALINFLVCRCHPTANFSPFNCCLSVVLWLVKWAYPENSHVAFCLFNFRSKCEKQKKKRRKQKKKKEEEASISCSGVIFRSGRP